MYYEYTCPEGCTCGICGGMELEAQYYKAVADRKAFLGPLSTEGLQQMAKELGPRYDQDYRKCVLFDALEEILESRDIYDP